MTEPVVFFSKHAVLDVLALHLVNVYISHLKCTTLRIDKGSWDRAGYQTN